MTKRERRKFKKRKKREERIRQAKHRAKSGKLKKPYWSGRQGHHPKSRRRKRSGVVDWLNLRPDQKLKYRKKI